MRIFQQYFLIRSTTVKNAISNDFNINVNYIDFGRYSKFLKHIRW